MRRGLGLAAGVLVALVLATPAARTADEQKIKQAIDRGVDYLKRLQKEHGDWHYTESGMTSLAALTLLECGVPSSDSSIQNAAAYIREAAVTEEKTYSLALAIMFLDRLGEEVDVALIEAMAARLLSGQRSDGGWAYKSGTEIVGNQQERLRQAILRRADAKGERKAPGATERRAPTDLGQDAKQEIDNILRRGPVPPNGPGGVDVGRSDNSNTQFAILALWTARRYGVPVENALTAVEKRFRASQNGDGGWGYLAGGMGGLAFNQSTVSTSAMTCAGLIGLAMHNAVANESALRTGPAGKDGDSKRKGGAKPPRDIGQDPQVTNALRYLAGALAAGIPTGGPPGFGPPGGVRPQPGGRPPQGVQPPQQGGRQSQAGYQPPPGVQAPQQGGRQSQAGYQPPPGAQLPGGKGQFPQGGPGGMGMPNKDLRLMGRFYYFLWSLERTAVAFGLDKIGDKDWYTWGADFLVADQEKDGSWRGVHGDYGADTCFALLFLRRADLAKDLSASMRNKVKNPTELRAGPGPFKGRDSIKPIRSPFEDGVGNDQNQDHASTRPNTRPTKPSPSPSPTKPSTAAANGNAEIAKLGAELVDAPAPQFGQALAKLRDGEGAQYTQALANAVAQLDGDQKKKARQALAERLSNLKSTILPRYMEDDNPELRRAAALACALKEDMAHVGKVIDLLNDPERTVERAAYAALKDLTKQDFGPAADASDEEKAKAIKKWKAWWKDQGEK
jgi:hypothetical protein